jgi:aconitase B
MQSWADAEWFTTRKDVPTEIKLTVFKVTGETTLTTCHLHKTHGAARHSIARKCNVEKRT